MGEFDLIEACFKPLSQAADTPPLDLGIGDDCALVSIPVGKQLAISSDTLVAGIHFPLQTTPEDIGYKALAVNLSDLAAMGAEPAWFSLCLTLADQSQQWVQSFCAGMGELIETIPIRLIGGDTTSGAQLSITIQVMGLVDEGQALRRSGAQLDDDIYVSGCIGDAAVGLHCILNNMEIAKELEPCVQRINRPMPRNALSEKIRCIASSCIDVSDGLLADLNHLMKASGVAAQLDLNAVPVSTVLADQNNLQCLKVSQSSTQFDSVTGARMWAMSSGDDYELCFTAAPKYRDQVQMMAQELGLAVTRIGEVVAGQGLFNKSNPGESISPKGYQHF